MATAPRANSASEDKAKADARVAIYEGITNTVADLCSNATPPAAAEGLRHLAEAYAYVAAPNNSH